MVTQPGPLALVGSLENIRRLRQVVRPVVQHAGVGGVDRGVHVIALGMKTVGVTRGESAGDTGALTSELCPQ